MTTQDQSLAEIRQELAHMRNLLSGPEGIKALFTRRITQLQRELNQEFSTLLRQILADTLPDSLRTFAPDIASLLVPRLADGDILTGPTQIALAGEAGPEAVLPLQRRSDGRLGVVIAGQDEPLQQTQSAMHIHLHPSDDVAERQGTDVDMTEISSLVSEAFSSMIDQKIADFVQEQLAYDLSSRYASTADKSRG